MKRSGETPKVADLDAGEGQAGREVIRRNTMERMAAEAVHEVPAHCTVEIKLGELLHAGRNPLLLQQLRSISVQGATQFEVGHCRGVMVGRRRGRRRRRRPLALCKRPI